MRPITRSCSCEQSKYFEIDTPFSCRVVGWLYGCCMYPSQKETFLWRKNLCHFSPTHWKWQNTFLVFIEKNGNVFFCWKCLFFWKKKFRWKYLFFGNVFFLLEMCFFVWLAINFDDIGYCLCLAVFGLSKFKSILSGANFIKNYSLRERYKLDLVTQIL